MLVSERLGIKGLSTNRDFQSRPLHMSICSSSKDRSTHGTNSCKKIRNEEKAFQIYREMLDDETLKLNMNTK